MGREIGLIQRRLSPLIGHIVQSSLHVEGLNSGLCR